MAHPRAYLYRICTVSVPGKWRAGLLSEDGLSPQTPCVQRKECVAPRQPVYLVPPGTATRQRSSEKIPHAEMLRNALERGGPPPLEAKTWRCQVNSVYRVIAKYALGCSLEPTGSDPEDLMAREAKDAQQMELDLKRKRNTDT